MLLMFVVVAFAAVAASVAVDAIAAAVAAADAIAEVVVSALLTAQKHNTKSLRAIRDAVISCY